MFGNHLKLSMYNKKIRPCLGSLHNMEHTPRASKLMNEGCMINEADQLDLKLLLERISNMMGLGCFAY